MLSIVLIVILSLSGDIRCSPTLYDFRNADLGVPIPVPVPVQVQYGSIMGEEEVQQQQQQERQLQAQPQPQLRLSKREGEQFLRRFIRKRSNRRSDKYWENPCNDDAMLSIDSQFARSNSLKDLGYQLSSQPIRHHFSAIRNYAEALSKLVRNLKKQKVRTTQKAFSRKNLFSFHHLAVFRPYFFRSQPNFSIDEMQFTIYFYGITLPIKRQTSCFPGFILKHENIFRSSCSSSG